MDKYVLTFLKPGQQVPVGSTGVSINDGLVCIVPELDADFINNELKQIVIKGDRTSTDLATPDVYYIREMTNQEIYDYNNPVVEETVESLETRIVELETELSVKTAELDAKTSELDAITSK